MNKAADHNNPTLPYLIENHFVHCNENKLSANFMVFDSNNFNKLCETLGPIIETVSNCMIQISDRAEVILMEHAPASVREQCCDIAKIHHRMDVASFLMEHLIATGKLIVPREKTPLCIWGVRD